MLQWQESKVAVVTKEAENAIKEPILPEMKQRAKTQEGQPVAMLLWFCASCSQKPSNSRTENTDEQAL